MAMREKGIRILLSYHRHDIEWRDSFDRQAKPFQEKGQLDISYNEVAEASQSFGDNQKDLRSFDVIILCISKKYLSLNNFIEKEIPEKILALQERGPHVIPVYLEDCSWQSISWLREIEPWPSHQLPFSNMTIEEREKFISRLIKDELFPRANVDTSKSTGIGNERIWNANKLKAENRLEEALMAYEQIIHEEPHNFEAKTGKADVLKMMGRLDEALMGYEQSIGEYQEDFVAKIGKAEVLKMMNRLEESLKAYEQIIYEYPENDVAETGRADVLLRLDRVSKISEDERLHKGRAYDGDDDFRDDDFRDDDWRKDFTRFLTEEKKWLEIDFANEKYKTISIDLSIRHPESKKLIAVINFKKSIDRKIESKAEASFAQFAELELGKYLVTPSTEKSNYSFAIYKYSDRGLVRIQPNDFPAYEGPDRETPDKKLSISNFKVGLLFDEIEICDKIINLAGDSNIGLYAEDTHESYVNLRLEGSKKTDNVAVQIHKYGENENKIALAVVGPGKGIKVSEPELTGFVTKGEISKLSGHKKVSSGEIAWLNGNLPKTGSREKASVYVINPEILENPDAWYDVEAILDLGVENIEKSPQKEPEKPKIEPEMLSTARNAVGDSETEDDKLGFGPYVEAVAEFLVHEDTHPPLTMSVEGEWGSGKSSFMRQLKKEIKRIYSEQGKKKCFIVEFDPWRHDKDEALWAAFALSFIGQVSGKLGLRKRLYANMSLKLTQYNWREGWADFAKVVGLLIVWLVVTGVLVTLVYKGVPLDQNGNIKLPGWIGSTAVIAGALFVALGKVKDFLGSPLTVDLKKYMKKPDYVSKISFIEKFHKDFEKIVQSYAGNERVYVFIDDLDRCRIPKAAELMESINLMLSDNPKLVFIMGMDREKVAAGLVVKHEKLLPYLSSQVEVGSGSGRYDTRMRGIRYGYSFIEKFVQIPFILPIPSSYDIENMLLEIAGEKERPTEPVKKIVEPPFEEPEPKPDVPSKETKEADRAERKEIRKEVMLKFEGDDKNFRSVVLMVSEAFGNNPRRVKQFVSLFRLRIRTAASTGLIKPEERQLTFVQLGKFVGIGLGWPLFIRDLERNPRLLDKLVDVAESANEPIDIDGKIKEWNRDEKLIGLIKSGCFDENKEKKPGGEYERFSMRGLDVKKLLQVAPRFMSIEEVMA